MTSALQTGECYRSELVIANWKLQAFIHSFDSAVVHIGPVSPPARIQIGNLCRFRINFSGWLDKDLWGHRTNKQAVHYGIVQILSDSYLYDALWACHSATIRAASFILYHTKGKIFWCSIQNRIEFMITIKSNSFSHGMVFRGNRAIWLISEKAE